MVGCSRRWPCWACLIALCQACFLVLSALLQVLARPPLEDTMTSGQADEAERLAIQAKLLEPFATRAPEAPVLLSDAWLGMYGAGASAKRVGGKPAVWVLCPWGLKKHQAWAVKPVVGKSNVVSIDRYFYPEVFANFEVAPTHHWQPDMPAISSGHCLKELEHAQAKHRKAAGEKRSRQERLKFQKGFGDCYLAQEVALAAAKSGVQLVAPKPVIKLLKSLKFPTIDAILHEENDWLAEHPLPVKLGKQDLLRAIGLAVSLTPQGSTIKLVGCSRSSWKKDMAKMREQLRRLARAGPGWDVVSCDPRSELVKLGITPGVSCTDERDGEYDLEPVVNFTD